MAKATPKPGEIWTFTDNSTNTREALILSVFEDGYAEYILLHAFRKGTENVEVAGRGMVMYCDPRKLSYKHTDTFTGQTRAISPEKLTEIRLLAAKGIGVEPNDPSGLKERLKSALESVESMRKKIGELNIYKTIYEQFLKACADAMQGKPAEEPTKSAEPEKTPEPEAPKTLTKIEQNRLKVQENRKKYGPKQSYIGVKLKTIGMPQVALDRLIGRSDGCVAHWVRGDSKAHWISIERIIPGIEKEAEEWAKNQEEEKK